MTLSTANKINNILIKAQSLRGYTLDYLTEKLSINKPESLVHAKGLTGQIIEVLLGATAKSKPLPDFPDLNLEIKTLPIDLNLNPLETTFVCSAPLTINKNSPELLNFKSSVVYKKLSKVLWVPIITAKATTRRTIGNAFIWNPDAIELKQLKTDWLELTDMIYMGNIEKVSSHFGEVLQIRPKAANSSCTTAGIGADGEQIATLPRGFYLRTSFTKILLQRYCNNANILP